ncbi:unnamed protein product [Symbiodinium sp. CCMP2592]|nr:unnamed protein product [Symbiodinium sp. CCMP2592]
MPPKKKAAAKKAKHEETWVGRMQLRTYNPEEDQHPCKLVEQYFGPDADNSLPTAVNHWLSSNGHPEVASLHHTFPAENTAANIPLLSFSLPIPVDQAPPLVTWSKFAPSIFSCWENEREPLEVRPLGTPALRPGDLLSRASVAVCRGYSRSTIIGFGIARTLMVEDIGTMPESEKEEFTRWLLNVLYVKVLYTPRLTHEYSYRNMQLSVQAADRQRKNILQMALRFHQRAQQMETPELLGPHNDPMEAAFKEYNSFGLAEQTDQYKLAEKDCQAMKVLMASVCEDVRLLMARHLQSNVWADCAYSLENVKSVRWHLGSAGRSEGLWKEIMMVTKQKQCCFIQRVHFHFQVKRRQVRTAQHARLNPEAWDTMLEGVCFLVWVLDAMRVAMTDDGAAPLFSSDVLRVAFQKVLEGLPDLDYSGEAEKHSMLRLPDVKPQDCSMWSDHLPKDPAKSALKDCKEQISKLDQESIQKQFEADCYKLSFDLSSFANHVEALGKNKRTAQIAKVCHVRAEMKRGSNSVVDFIEKMCPHHISLYSDRDTSENIKKASIQSPSPYQWMNGTRPDAVIVWADLTKFGRVSNDTVNDLAELMRGVLQHSPQRSVGIIIVPVLASAKVANGIRGEIRRLEDKLDAKCNRQPIEWMLERDYKALEFKASCQDWKAGNNLIGAATFKPEPAAAEASDSPAVNQPTFNLCVVTETPEGNMAIALPPGIRSKWSEDSARKEEWAQVLKKFDASVHTTSSAASASTATTPAADSAAPTSSPDPDDPWGAEPQTVEDLDARYDTAHSFPGRNSSTILRITPSLEKSQSEPKLCAENQQFKLFLIANADVTIPKTEYQIAHDRASFLAGPKVQKLMDRANDLMDFLMASHSNMPAAPLHAAEAASSASPTHPRLTRSSTPPTQP